jgi:DNA-binding response OmpR family regulator
MTNDFRALVAEDDRAMCMLTIQALAREGFLCDAVADGNQAQVLTQQRHYHLVVTDLRMPGTNGHALAAELLQGSTRPLVAVLTGVVEPRLAKDLIVRGVDDLTFKPVDCRAYAAKLRALVIRSLMARHRELTSRANGDSAKAPGEHAFATSAGDEAEACAIRLDTPDLAERLSPLR